MIVMVFCILRFNGSIVCLGFGCRSMICMCFVSREGWNTESTNKSLQNSSCLTRKHTVRRKIISGRSLPRVTCDVITVLLLSYFFINNNRISHLYLGDVKLNSDAPFYPLWYVIFEKSSTEPERRRFFLSKRISRSTIFLQCVKEVSVWGYAEFHAEWMSSHHCMIEVIG